MKLFKLFPIIKQKFPKISKFVFEKKEHQNSGTLCKDTINHWIISFLSVEKRFSFNKGVQPDVYFLDVT